jgi:hypothetical protein
MSTRLRFVLLAGLLSLPVGPLFGQEDAGDIGPKIAQKYREGVVVLTSYRGPRDQRTGTGFLIGKDTIITNEHVISGALSVYADFYGNAETVQCELIDSNADLDLAALRLVSATKKQYPLLIVDKNVDLDALQGITIFLIGHPVKLNWSFITGVVSGHETLGDLFRKHFLNIQPKDPAQQTIQLDVNSTFGMSGAPVLNKRERVVGVQRLGYKEGQFGINFCIPASYIKQLDVDKATQPFGGGNGPQLQGLQALGMLGPNAAAPQAGAFNIRTRAWGFVPNNADLIFTNYIEDQVAFEKFIKKPLLEEMVARGGGIPCIVHLTNPFFRYSMLSPNWYHIDEVPGPDRVSIKSVITHDSREVPAGLNRVTIFAKKASPIDRKPGDSLDDFNKALIDEFNKQANDMMLNTLGLELVDANNPPLNPTNRQVALSFDLSDPAPRVHNFKPIVRFCRVYNAPTQFDQSYFVLYGLSGDSFVTLTFEFKTSESFKQANWNVDWVERLFIAGSLSFFE